MLNPNTDVNLQFQEEFWRALFRFSYISTFRKLAATVMQSSNNNLVAEAIELIQLCIANGYLTEMGKQQLADPNMMSKIVSTHVSSQIDDFRALLDSASLVFAHSFLDRSLYSFLYLTATISPKRWEPFVKSRKAALSELKNLSYDDLLLKYITSDLEDIARKSIMIKAKRLLLVCSPQRDFAAFDCKLKVYSYNEQRLIDIDRNRHNAIHGAGMPIRIGNIDDDIEYLRDTALFFFEMLRSTFKLHFDMSKTEGIARELSGTDQQVDCV